MDISDDLVIIENPIVDFLGQNIRKVRNEIDKVEETIKFLSNSIEEVLNERAAGSLGVKLLPPLLKLYQNKYAVWYRVECSTNKCFKNFEFLLHWSSEDELTYVSSMHPIKDTGGDINNPLIYIDTLEKKAFLVVTFDRPNFVKDHSIQVDGFLSYWDEHGQEYVDEIQPIIIKNTDISNKSLRISPTGNPDIINFHTRLICSFKVDLVLQLQAENQLPLALFSASLTPHASVTDELQRFYTLNDDSYVFNGTIVEVTSSDGPSNISEICVYTKDVDSSLAFFHHLHQTMKPVVLLPSEYKSRVFENWDVREKERDLNDCLDKEFGFLIDFSKNSGERYGDYPNIRNDLINIEHDTDSAYVAYLRTKNGKE
ncbi:uncharacterized protein LOC123307922 [Coccinella septempunctata]|uniref:uncharacterized protein LOC123307922 n=1 Tax=Coccinella septempunctata TaxID=41139 RepID=UPI001D095DA8|nr:uncharacterized protein LOC123307922 [Coccinella septempunctata]